MTLNLERQVVVPPEEEQDVVSEFCYCAGEGDSSSQWHSWIRLWCWKTTKSTNFYKYL